MAGRMEQDGAGAGGRDDDVFVVLRPQTPGRFVFASPHSGTVYPSGMGADPALPEASLRSAEDALVDRLIAPGVDLGATVVLARLGRAWVDLNRDPADLDPQLIEGAPDGSVSARTAAGYGVIPRLTGDGRGVSLSPLLTCSSLRVRRSTGGVAHDDSHFDDLAKLET